MILALLLVGARQGRGRPSRDGQQKLGQPGYCKPSGTSDRGTGWGVGCRPHNTQQGEVTARAEAPDVPPAPFEAITLCCLCSRSPTLEFPQEESTRLNGTVTTNLQPACSLLVVHGQHPMGWCQGWKPVCPVPQPRPAAGGSDHEETGAAGCQPLSFTILLGGRRLFSLCTLQPIWAVRVLWPVASS